MKIKYFLIAIFILTFFNCSKDNIEDTEVEITITRCFTVKELGTNIPIENARVILATFVCGAGCGELMLGNEPTDSNGQVCFILSENDNEAILKIRCTANDYSDFEINLPDLTFSEIYLEPISN